ncbi:uncharacterized protein LOC129913873 [Episyrphus balteatus]|uniref:uncharacterized protein LOC129913873 n=1 Tax=Episyrphus balteatus TaxID=286459 RepID=UPI0024862F2A|nr:uncharacterized protein LOC129913873 [Episyrphus balteatus]
MSSLQKDLTRSDSSASSNQDLDDIFIDHTDLEALDDVAPQKRHFLDYDAVAPPGFEEDFSAILTIGGGGPPSGSSHQKVSSSSVSSGLGENLKIDKKYERDGEISDYELAASGYTKKEFTQDDNTLVVRSGGGSSSGAFGKKKHFLDENPIPPDYMLDKDMREHRSLDRNFERQHDFQRSTSGSSGRKHSLDRDRDSRGSTRKYKEPSYTLSRFIASDLVVPPMETSSLAWSAAEERTDGSQYSGLPKAECVYSLASMLGSHDSVDVSKKFLELSRTGEACVALRKSGCIPLLVQMMHSDANDGVRKYAGMALHNVVHSHPDDKVGRREAKVLRLIEQILDYCNFLKTLLQSGGEAIADDSDRHPLAAISSLMKVSFDEEHRHAMCQLGALQAIASLVHLDHAVHGPKSEDECCNSLRRYALMALTNLTFGDENNKTLLCANKEFMEALVAQLNSAPDDLLQVTASVLRNLSWRVDNNMKAVLNEIGTVTALAKAAMLNKNENTLKAILSALWNLSAHCSTNKAEYCAVTGALAFLVDMLTYEGPSKTLKIIENAGGILRNVSSHIAVREDYRKILRERNCLAILLQQLKSESLTVVSNACGTLWNLSARSAEDQKFLWDNGAVPMLRSLIHSKHKLISEGSSAALKNLQNFRPSILNPNNMDPIARSMGLKELPTLNARKQKALEQELVNQNLSETCENIDVVTPPKERNDFTPLTDPRKFPPPPVRLTRSAVVSKSESRDSIFSAKSDSAYEMMRGNSALVRGKMPPDRNIEFAVKTTAAFDVENETEQPIDYSAKYSEGATSKSNKSLAESGPKSNQKGLKTARNYSSYQETDLDQPTDFSLRYAENQVESDMEEKTRMNNGSEIILILEDSVKCYQTEDTPYVISNAPSVSDLQNPKLEENIVRNKPQTSVLPSSNVIYGSGSYTPEKPINYCEEGTPGYFSRYESLSSLEESPQNAQTTNGTAPTKSKADKTNINVKEETIKSPEPPAVLAPTDVKEEEDEKPVLPQNAQESGPCAIISKNNYNSAQETPLMFSRHSSMDSLAEEEEVGAIVADDKSSVVSDFSRLASGVISPSDIPDSPTQSMPQSPRRNSNSQLPFSSAGVAVTGGSNSLKSQNNAAPPRLRSVFEDDLNTFQVENTPAQFSCATSLSNLSLDDEQPTDKPDMDLMKAEGGSLTNSCPDQKQIETVKGDIAFSEGEEETNDDYLLATCINIGMNRDRKETTEGHKDTAIILSPPAGDSTKQYFTEDTPALLSKVGSNTNLSSISLLTNPLGNKIEGEMVANLSDDVSSNASEAGGLDLLEQCIRDGMQKPVNIPKDNVTSTEAHAVRNIGGPPQIRKSVAPRRRPENTTSSNDPIAMLRRGGLSMNNFVPQINDEMNKYLVEDSPCNFSMMSDLSNLTVGSSIVGPALMKKLPSGGNDYRSSDINEPKKMHHPQMPHPHQSNIADDSLSSLSIESEEDTNLLSQAIAAGCNRPKSNLGFNSSNKRPLSSSQPIPTSSRSAANQHLPSNHHHHHQKAFDGNESISSVDSSDSNDNQSKSLFEQCIRTGMNKKTRHHSDKLQQQGRSSTSNPNLNVTPKLSQLSSIPRVPNPKTPIRLDRERQRDRERKDEQLLQECINTGMAKSAAGTNQIKPPARHTRHMLSSVETMFNQKRTNDPHPQPTYLASFATPHMQPASPMVIPTMAPPMTQKMPKNGETTSAAVLEQSQHREITTSPSAPNTAPGVGMKEYPDGTKDPKNLQHLQSMAVKVEEVVLTLDSSRPMTIGSSTSSAEGGGGGAESLLLASMNTTWTDEYPGQEMISSQDSFQESQSVSFDMDNSSHQQQVTPTVPNKHKDPDLMLKSVERLTHDYVSTAEYLRAADNSDLTDEAVCNNKYNSNTTTTTSNNTWSEDTCPNDVSFPSVSISAPMIASLQDDDDEDDQTSMQIDHTSFRFKGDLHDFAEITPTNEIQPFESLSMQTMNTVEEVGTSQPNSLETETDTLVNDEIAAVIVSENEQFTELSSEGIRFQVGGEVKRVPLQAAATNTYLTPAFGGVPSVMTNSTIIAFEANRLADNLLNDMAQSTNSLDLDNIRPPSCMESLSMSGCYEVPQSPQLSRLRKKSLPAGIVARRALGHLPAHLNGSLESVNSSCNLENIKPPSLMDELLDSMISVSSIQSEIVDQSLNNTTMSNYETAYDFDDNTVTLHSCSEILPNDGYDSNETPLQSDFSSAESTPRKYRNVNGVKRTLTPKQKRKLVKDRFKTYTIAADFALNENYSGELQELDFDGDEDEVLQIEIEEIDDGADNAENAGGNLLKKSPSAIQKRNANPERYRTRTISYTRDQELNNFDIQSIGASNDQESLTSTDDCSEEMSSIKAMTKQFKFIASSDLIAEPNTTDIEEGCSMQTVVIAPSTTTTAESDYNSMECDQTSETESCYQNNYQNDDEAPAKRLIRPRIVKLGDKDSGTEVNFSEDGLTPPESVVKAVRGRKKPQYISPYRKTTARPSFPSKAQISNITNIAVNKTSQLKKLPVTSLKQKNAATTKPLSGVVALKKSDVPSKLGSIVPSVSPSKKSAAKNDTLVVPSVAPPPTLERQGTFVQDEPTITDVPVPVVVSPTRASKLPLKKSIATKLKPPSSKVAPTVVGKLPRQVTMPARPYTAASSIDLKRKGLVGVRKSPSVPTVPQRSNSNASIRVTPSINALRSNLPSTTPPSRSNSNLTTATKINQISSRIAGIWKKVDEAKRTATKTTPMPTATAKQAATTAAAKPSQMKTTGKLNRSSTFDNSPSVVEPSSKKQPVATGSKGASHLHHISPTKRIPITVSPRKRFD